MMKATSAANVGAAILALGLGAAPAAARDRPGTPKFVELRNCGVENLRPLVCGTVGSGASEDTSIEHQLTENGQPVPPYRVLIYCPIQDHRMPQNRHDNSVTIYPCAMRDVIRGEATSIFAMHDLAFGAAYCIRLRARRTSDGVVSELWSAPACVTTPPAPPPPKAPQLQIFYAVGAGPDGRPSLQYGASASVARPLVDAWSTLTIAVDGKLLDPYTSQKAAYDSKDSNDFTIRECMRNAIGEACTEETISPRRQAVTALNGRPFVLTGKPAY